MTSGRGGRSAAGGRRRAPGARSARLALWCWPLAGVLYTAGFWSNPIGGGSFSPFGETSLVLEESRSYLDFYAGRSAGYPAFLDWAVPRFGGLEGVIRAQLVLTAAAVSFLGFALARAAAAPRFALLLLPGLLAAAAVPRFHAYILSEALFVPLVLGSLGALALFAARPRAAPLAAAAACSGLAVAVRPSAALLLLAWPLVFWLLWRELGTAGTKRRALLLALGAALVAAGFLWESRAHAGARGRLGERPNIVHRHLFAKALLIPSAPSSFGDPAVDRFFAEERRYTAPLREFVARAPDPALRALLLGRAETALQHPTYRRRFLPRLERLAAVAEPRREGSPGRLAGEIGRAALLAAPGEWAENALRHLVTLWTHASIHRPEFARTFRDYAGTAPPTTLFREARATEPAPESRGLSATLWSAHRAAALAVFAASLLVLGLAVFRRLGPGASPGPLLTAAAAASVSAHGYFTLVAALNFGKMRYSAAMWPLEVVCLWALLAFALFGRPVRPPCSAALFGRPVRPPCSAARSGRRPGAPGIPGDRPKIRASGGPPAGGRDPAPE